MAKESADAEVQMHEKIFSKTPGKFIILSRMIGGGRTNQMCGWGALVISEPSKRLVSRLELSLQTDISYSSPLKNIKFEQYSCWW